MIHETITFVSKFLLYVSLNMEVSHLSSGSQKFHEDPARTAMFQAFPEWCGNTPANPRKSLVCEILKKKKRFSEF